MFSNPCLVGNACLFGEIARNWMTDLKYYKLYLHNIYIYIYIYWCAINMYLSKVEKINYVQIVHIVCVRLQKTLLLGVTNHPFRISNPSEREDSWVPDWYTKFLYITWVSIGHSYRLLLGWVGLGTQPQHCVGKYMTWRQWLRGHRGEKNNSWCVCVWHRHIIKMPVACGCIWNITSFVCPDFESPLDIRHLAKLQTSVPHRWSLVWRGLSKTGPPRTVADRERSS